MLDLSNVSMSETSNEFELIPEGTIARAILLIKPNHTIIEEFASTPMFKESPHSSAKYIETEFTIVGGQFDKRKVWQNIFFDGDSKNDQGISKARVNGIRTLRLLVDSMLGLDPKDVSVESNNKRKIPGIDALQGQEFCIKIGIEKGTNGYADKNILRGPICADHKGFIAGGVVQVAPQVQQPIDQGVQPQATTAGSVVPPWAS
jgi:hypothetical protein|tara:strand:+ start:1351 stop:1962 length:612 start_codon:yes stop_codon:yes gene_type:complete